MAEKILIVDDDLETLRLVGLMLQRQGYQIISARNGAEGIHQAANDHPDLIVLDVMMPDMDGYQVAQVLREQPDTAVIPILMFTAKSQVDDKVAGYEAGADDYLTKPVHPAELIAHIKALLARTKNRTVAPQRKGTLIGVMAVKGGLGVSTLAFNLALAYYNHTHSDVIAAEMRSGQGTWSGELGFSTADGLSKLLARKPSEITLPAIENELIRTTYGIRLLLASPKFEDFSLLEENPEQISALLEQLANINATIFVDIGNPFTPGFDRMVAACDEITIVAEPQPYSLKRTKDLIEELGEKGIGKSRILNVVVVNRIRADIQLSANQIQEVLGRPITLVIPPAPEQSYHAAMRNIPLIQIQQEGILSQQINRLATIYAERLKK
jgi:DNA-binding response OmpR family regulator